MFPESDILEFWKIGILESKDDHVYFSVLIYFELKAIFCVISCVQNAEILCYQPRYGYKLWLIWLQ
jgi:hypothetical protein